MLSQGHIRGHLLPVLNVGGLRRWIVYRPLAVTMAILLLPFLSWIEGAGTRPFQANAQVGGCTSTTNSIIQSYCVNNTDYFTDLTQLEQDAVNAYLAAHILPASDAHLIYDQGRTDLRTAVRGAMLTIVLGAISTPAPQRTAHQQSLVNWMQSIAWADEIGQYTIALNTFKAWEADPCHFALDSVVQKAYSLSYDGSPYCFQQTLAIVGAPVPSETYFRAYGLLKSYGSQADMFPDFGNLVAGTGVNVGIFAGIGVSAFSVAAAAAAAAGSQLAAALATAEEIYNLFGVEAAQLGTESSLITGEITAVSGETVAEIGGGIGTLVAAPVIIVLAGVAIGIAAAIEIVQNQEQIETVNTDLNNALTQAQNAPPDIAAMASDTAGQGFYKLQQALDSQTTPEVPSTSALPVHQNGIDPDFILTPGGLSHTLTYQDWNANVWTAETSGGWFVQTCVNGPDKDNPCGEATSMTTDLHYLDANGVQWTASRQGYNFVITKSQPDFNPPSGVPIDAGCPADLLTGLTPTPVPPSCWTYVANSVTLKLGDGSIGTVILSPYTLPGFNSSTTLSFAPGIPSAQTITAVGNPTPSICYSSGTLPSNFQLNGGSCGSGSFQIVFDGGLSAPTGTYSLTLTADGGQKISQIFSINVATQLAIISSNTINGFAGFPVNFPVVATGNPTPALTLDAAFSNAAPGLTLTDNHNGTGIISGTYTGTPGTISCTNVDLNTGQTLPCGIVATNSQGRVEQQVTLNMVAAPTATIPGCNAIGVCSPGVSFIAGIPYQALLTATGAITHVSWSFFNGQSPAPWLQLKDNGDGTALLTGTPPVGTTGTLTAGILPFAIGSFGTVDNYPVTVVNVPQFTSGNTATFTVGTSGAFGIAANMGTISSGATLPNGLSFFQGSTLGCLQCMASISGSPAVGTGGQYAITLNDDAGTAGTATQSLTLNVNEGPSFSSPNLAVVFAGQQANFNTTTTGFPTIGTHQVAPSFGPPASASDGTGPYFTVSGLPSSLQASNFNSVGLRTGTLTISGTPATTDVGTHKVQITIQNGVGSPAPQTLTLQVIPNNPTTAISLLSVWTLSRDASNNVIATIVVPNNGSQTAQNVSITSAKIGSVAGVVSPSAIASIPPESSATFRIQFPAASLGASGSPNVLSLSGTYTGGTFNNAGRIVLP
jgi:hypothetical protein